MGDLLLLRAGAPGVDDREGRASPRVLRQARAVGVRARAPADAHVLRARRGDEVPGRPARAPRRDAAGAARQRARRRGGRRREAAPREAGRGALVGAEPARPEGRRERGTTTHVIEPAVETRFVRLNIIRPTYSGEPIARIYEFEIYGPDGRENLALGRPVTGSVPCSPDEGPEKAVNGSVTGGETDRWCADDRPLFLQVDLGSARAVKRFVVKHASAGGEDEESDTREFNIQVSGDGKLFTTVESSSGAAFVEERTEYRSLTYFDGRRDAPIAVRRRQAREQPHQPPAELRRRPDDLRGDLPVLLPAAGDLLRLPRHVHVSLPRRDEQPHAALLVPRAGAARRAARRQVRRRTHRGGRDLRRRRPARRSRP